LNKIYIILINGKNFGYLWVNGPEDATNVVGNILFDSLKTRIQYELNQDMALKSLTVDDQLIKELLKDNHRNYNYIDELMNKLNFDRSKPRVSIYIVKDDGFDKREITGLKYKINDRSTIYSLLKDRSLVIFKSIPQKIEEKRAQDYIANFIKDLIEWGLSECYYSVGTTQTNPDLYNFSYENCLWVRENIQMKKDMPVYFEDHLFSYFTSKSSQKVMSNIFDYYESKASSIDIDEFIKIIEGLYINDFSIKKTSETLFLHKNTLLYKIKKYEELFNIDIRGSFQDKLLVYMLANYFRDDESNKQAGVNQ